MKVARSLTITPQGVKLTTSLSQKVCLSVSSLEACLGGDNRALGEFAALLMSFGEADKGKIVC